MKPPFLDPNKPISTYTAHAILRLYTEWGVDVTITDSPFHHQHSLSKNKNSSRSPVFLTDPQAQQNEIKTPLPLSTDSLTHIITQATTLAAQANSLEELYAVMTDFSLCSLQKTAIHTIIPQGPHNAPLMIIGGIPDADEDRNGHPFTGHCGAALNEILAYLPISRDQLALATAIPWRPPGGRPISDLERQICLPFLQRTITLIAPQRLLLCGNTPLTMLFGRQTSISRKQWHNLTFSDSSQPLPTLSITHPIQLRVSATARREIWHSLMLIINSLRQTSLSNPLQ